MTNYYEGKIFRTNDGKVYTNDVDGEGFSEISSGESPSVPDTMLVKSGDTADNHLAVWDGNNSNTLKDGGAVPSGNGGGAQNRPYFTYLAAQMEPMALEEAQIGAFNYLMSAGYPKLLIASFNTRLGTDDGRMEQRNPTLPFICNTDLSLHGLDTNSTAIILDPNIITYTDAEDTYYSRLNLLASDPIYQQKCLTLNGSQTKTFLPGPYGNLILQVTSFDYNWIIGKLSSGQGWNLWNEIGDTTIERYGNSLILPVSKSTLNALQSSGSGKGSVVYVILPSTWSRVVDDNEYSFRDDFMTATIAETNKWSINQSSAGNIEIDPTFQWCKWVGSHTWGADAAYSVTSFARTLHRRFECDVVFGGNSGNDGGIVGFSNGQGYSYSDFCHGLNFNGNSLTVFENGTDRGNVGTTFTPNTIYRVRITLANSNAAVYEIQGGAQYAPIGSNRWTDITPAVSHSTATTLHAGFTAWGNTNYISDVKVAG